jgi:hypothetical protein
MGKLLKLFLLVTQIFFLLGGQIHSVAAKALGVNYKYLPVLQTGNNFTFDDLGYEERIMVGPYDLESIFFSTPPTWQLTSGTINLRFTTGGTFAGESLESAGWVGGSIFVYFNEELIDTVLLDQTGEATKEIQIPANALEPVTDDGRHILSFLFDATYTCDFEDFQENLIISSDSVLDLQYQPKAPSVDLSSFPFPIYQPNSPSTTNLTLVVPDQPSADELQAALTVSAGLGYIVDDGLDLTLVSLSELSENILNSNNIIFVGLPTELSSLQDVEFPVPITNGEFVISGAAQDDGIIQIAQSPWNISNVVLLVSGNTDIGVIKAAQTVGTGVIVPSGREDVSVITQVNPETSVSVLEDRTLGDLGYTNETMQGTLGQYLSYYFYASPEQAYSTGAYIDLVTSHSDLLDYERSGITLLLNDEVVGSLRYDKDSDQVETTQIKFLPQVLNQGINRLEIIGDLKPVYDCYSTDIQDTWVTVSESSLIHLPNNSQQVDIGKNLDLQNFKYTFPTSENLKDLAFVLAHDDSQSWAHASKLANYLGRNGQITAVDLRVAYADSVPDEILQERNLIVIGRASTLPIVEQLNDALPAPFEPGSDDVVQPDMLVNYRVLPDVNTGYIQLLQSPWNSNLAILMVMGNTDEGVSLAGEALINDDLLNQIRGNFSILFGDQVLSVDTRLLGPSNNSMIENPPASDVIVSPTSTTNIFTGDETLPSGRADWILPTVVISTLVVLIIGIFAVWRGRSGKISEKDQVDSDN